MMARMTDAFICDAVRTPIGRYGGALAALRTDDLAALPLAALLKRNPSLEPGAIEEVLLGCANQAGEDNRNVARMAVLLAGLPVAVPGATVNRLCGSGLQAVVDAARAIQSGEAEIVVAGGVESMSRAPLVMGKPNEAFPRGEQRMYDTTLGWRFVNPRMKELHDTLQMGETAERVAERYQISREVEKLRGEIVAVEVPGKKGPVRVEADEHPRPDTTAESLAKLRPAFAAQ